MQNGPRSVASECCLTVSGDLCDCRKAEKLVLSLGLSSFTVVFCYTERRSHNGSPAIPASGSILVKGLNHGLLDAIETLVF